MQQIGLWQVTGENKVPAKLKPSTIDMEHWLEGWIENDPALLETGLTVVGRQVQLEAGPLDLLAVDPQGRWVVIELKRGTVHRETIAQALDYAACVAAVPYEQLSQKVNQYLAKKAAVGIPSLESILADRAGGAETQAVPRDVRVLVVGTGVDRGLERLVGFLSGTYEIPIAVVSYHVFEIGDGQRILMRELTEIPDQGFGLAPVPRPSLEQVCAAADQTGIGPQFRAMLEAGRQHGLYPRHYKYSVMYAPPSHHNRTLFTVWSQPRSSGKILIWLGPEVFAQFFPPLTEEEVINRLGAGGWRELSPSDVDSFLTGLAQVFNQIHQNEQ